MDGFFFVVIFGVAKFLLIEFTCIAEHETHISYSMCVPNQSLIEFTSIVKHTTHIGYHTCIPDQFLIELARIVKHLTQIC